MQGEAGSVGPGRDAFARYPALTYSTIPEALAHALARSRVGCNGWAVMIALSRKIYADGRFGRASAKELSARCGLTRQQIARGMMDLRGKGIVEPVAVKSADGTEKPDRPAFGHVAQYRIASNVWATVKCESRER